MDVKLCDLQDFGRDWQHWLGILHQWCLVLTFSFTHEIATQAHRKKKRAYANISEKWYCIAFSVLCYTWVLCISNAVLYQLS